ncbi:hypothetical protein H6776_00930 [Candidatus Nomurabacteria bacterium]|nr:hypothetical protein [Candidatus Nomurabacteria bacterium]
MTRLFTGIFEAIGGLFRGIGNILQTLLRGGTPRTPEVHIPTSFHPEPITRISGVQFFFIVLGVIGLVFIIYIILREREYAREDDRLLHERFVRPRPEHVHETRWSKVEQLFSSSSEGDWRLGIIEADTMLEDLTLRLGFPGANLGERLKNIHPGHFPMLQQAWHVHLMRNRIAHEGLAYQLTQTQAWQAFKIYESIFRQYGYIG